MRSERRRRRSRSRTPFDPMRLAHATMPHGRRAHSPPARRLPLLGALGLDRGRCRAHRARRRRARDRLVLGVCDRARSDVRRERALSPVSLAVGNAPALGATTRSLDDLPLHRRELHAVRAPALPRHDALARARVRLGGRHARARPRALLGRFAAVAEGVRLHDGRLGRPDRRPTALLGRRCRRRQCS